MTNWASIRGLKVRDVFARRGDEVIFTVEAIDMRKGFEGLYGLVRDHLEQDPLERHLFRSMNRTRTRLKALVWDGSGFVVCAKRLERVASIGRGGAGTCSVTMRPEELAMLVNGLDVQHTKQRNWHRKGA